MKKEREIAENLLDYYQGNIVYNKKTSFFTAINLDKYCDSAFIKSNNEIMCTFRSNQDSHTNILISIDPKKPNLWGTVYESPPNNILTTLTVINNKLYVGEINSDTKKSYLTINKQTASVENIVNIIYPLQGTPYFASFQSVLNTNKQNYYQIQNNKILKQTNEKIIFYK